MLTADDRLDYHGRVMARSEIRRRLWLRIVLALCVLLPSLSPGMAPRRCGSDGIARLAPRAETSEGAVRQSTCCCRTTRASPAAASAHDDPQSLVERRAGAEQRPVVERRCACAERVPVMPVPRPTPSIDERSSARWGDELFAGAAPSMPDMLSDAAVGVALRLDRGAGNVWRRGALGARATLARGCVLRI